MTDLAPQTITAAVWLATDPPRPCPEVLTAEEAVIYLRMRRPGQSMLQALRTLGKYRREGKLRAAKSGNQFVYRRVDLDVFIEEQTRVK